MARFNGATCGGIVNVKRPPKPAKPKAGKS
jgi:hypothetical protein